MRAVDAVFALRKHLPKHMIPERKGDSSNAAMDEA
jgi:hypothetical protein